MPDDDFDRSCLIFAATSLQKEARVGINSINYGTQSMVENPGQGADKETEDLLSPMKPSRSPTQQRRRGFGEHVLARGMPSLKFCMSCLMFTAISHERDILGSRSNKILYVDQRLGIVEF